MVSANTTILKINKPIIMSDKAEHVRFLRWVKINFVQIGDMWTKRHPYHPDRLYSDSELYDYFTDYLRELNYLFI